MTVYIVALLHVFQNVVEVGRHAFLFEFVVAAPCPYLGRCRDKHLEFGFREHRCAYISPVHHDTFVPSHALLAGHHGRSYERNGRNRADMVAHFERPNGLFHVLTVEICVGPTSLFVELKRDIYVAHLLFQRIRFHASIGVK